MRITTLLLLIGVIFLFLKTKDYVSISNWWIFSIFFLDLIFFYYSIHKKNKERDTPRPVYLSSPE